MRIISWRMLLIFNYLCIYSRNTLKLGGMILLIRVRIRILISIKYLSWLSLIFFIIYVGGLLVLFFYLSSLKYNPLFSLNRLDYYRRTIIKVKRVILFGLISLRYTFRSRRFKFLNKNTNNFRTNLFKKEEFQTLILVGVLLLLVLWLVTKLTFNTRGALRPTF